MTSNNPFPCRNCGMTVVWRTSKNGKRYLAQIKRWSGTETFAERVFYPSHECTPDPEWQERHANVEAQRIANAMHVGRVERGCTVKVVKGRKVPHGTNGVVFWVAPDPDGYGVVKCGFTTADGEKIFINIENVICHKGV